MEIFCIYRQWQVVKIFVEDGKNDGSNDADPFKVSDVNTMLNYLKDK
jgi:peroxiredoxin